jgi:hypothetical protein
MQPSESPGNTGYFAQFPLDGRGLWALFPARSRLAAVETGRSGA